MPDIFKEFLNFDKLALADGKLTKKLKELIVIAVAHIVLKLMLNKANPKIFLKRKCQNL